MGIIGSTDPEINNIRFRASSSIFQNSECIFVEYMDCVQLPWFIFLMAFRNNEQLDHIFNLKGIRYLADGDLLQYYFNRIYRNPLADLLKRDKDNRIPFEELDSIVEDGVKDMKEAFIPEADTLVTSMLQNVIAMKLTKNIIVYSPYHSPYIEQDLAVKFKGFSTLVTGDIHDALEKTPKETTYIFSDVTHLLTMEEMDKMNYSAIMIPNDFRYNFIDDEMQTYKIDMKYLDEQYIFKWAKYRVI